MDIGYLSVLFALIRGVVETGRTDVDAIIGIMTREGFCTPEEVEDVTKEWVKAMKEIDRYAKDGLTHEQAAMRVLKGTRFDSN